MDTHIPNSSAPVYMGEFVHAIDGKNRITIPSQWRGKDEAELFLIPSTSSKCLKVMPRLELDRVRAHASSLAGAQRTVFQRFLGSQSRQVALDKNGRLSLPEEFCQQYKLSGDVMLSGAVETFEIWNTGEWKTAHPATMAMGAALMTDAGL